MFNISWLRQLPPISLYGIHESSALNWLENDGRFLMVLGGFVLRITKNTILIGWRHHEEMMRNSCMSIGEGIGNQLRRMKAGLVMCGYDFQA